VSINLPPPLRQPPLLPPPPCYTPGTPLLRLRSGLLFEDLDDSIKKRGAKSRHADFYQARRAIVLKARAAIVPRPKPARLELSEGLISFPWVIQFRQCRTPITGSLRKEPNVSSPGPFPDPCRFRFYCSARSAASAVNAARSAPLPLLIPARALVPACPSARVRSPALPPARRASCRSLREHHAPIRNPTLARPVHDGGHRRNKLCRVPGTASRAVSAVFAGADWAGRACALCR